MNGPWRLLRCGLLVVAVLMTAPAPAHADQCAELNAHVAKLDAQIRSDTVANSRALRIQDRNNWARARDAVCSGVGSGRVSGAPPGGPDRVDRALGAAHNIFGVLADYAAKVEARRQREAAEAEQRRLMWENQQAVEQAKREAEELEHKRRQAEARAADDRKRSGLTSPWDGGSRSGPTNPWALPSDGSRQGGSNNPWERPAAPAAAQHFKTDEEIKRGCAGSTNSGICELLAKDRRANHPEYQRWRAQESARLDRELREAQAKIDRALADYKTQRAGRASGGPRDSEDVATPCTSWAPRPGQTIPQCPPAPTPPLTGTGTRMASPSGDPATVRTVPPIPSDGKDLAQWFEERKKERDERLKRGIQDVPQHWGRRIACREAWVYDGSDEGQCVPNGGLSRQFSVNDEPPPIAEGMDEQSCRRAGGLYGEVARNPWDPSAPARQGCSRPIIGLDSDPEVRRRMQENLEMQKNLGRAPERN